MLKQLLTKWFGGNAAADAEAGEAVPVEYKGYRILARPQRAGEQWRVAAEVSREVDGQTKTHHLVRADVMPDRQQAADIALAKARLTIDQRGDGIFD